MNAFCASKSWGRLSKEDWGQFWFNLIAMMLIFTTVGFTFATTAQADVSLAMEDRLDSIPVKLADGQVLAITVIRDAWNAKQWYFIPDRPRLGQRIDANGKLVPDATLIIGQSETADGRGIIEEGVLQFSASLSIPAEAIPQVKEAIAAQYKTEKLEAEQITLAGLPLTSSTATVFVPDGQGILQAEAKPAGNGIGPSFCSNEQIFQVHLTRRGADLISTALRKGNGIGVSYHLTYDGLTPKAGFKVKVDYDKLQTHLSKDTKVKVKYSAWFGLVSGSAQYRNQEIIDDLISSKALEIEIIEGSGFKMDDIKHFLDPILARINKELEVVFASAPEKIPPAEAADPEAGGWFGVGVSHAVKEVKCRRKGTETISFSHRSHCTRTTVCGGFVSLKAYPQEIIDQTIIVVEPGPWRSSYFLLPAIGNSLGIDSATITVELRSKKNTLATRSAAWTVKDGAGQWNDQKGPLSILQFPLLALGVASKDELESCEYLMTLTLNSKESTLVLNRTIAAFNGSLPIQAPSGELVSIVEVDASEIEFGRLVNGASAIAAQVSIIAGDRSYRRTLRPIQQGGAWTAPQSVRFLIENSSTMPPIRVSAAIMRKHHATGQADKVFECLDLAKEIPGLTVILNEPATKESN